MSNTVSILNSLKPNTDSAKIDKLLCILEGNLELKIFFKYIIYWDYLKVVMS